MEIYANFLSLKAIIRNLHSIKISLSLEIADGECKLHGALIQLKSMLRKKFYSQVRTKRIH